MAQRISRRTVHPAAPRAADLPPRAHPGSCQAPAARLLDDHQAPPCPAHPPRRRIVHRGRRPAHPGHGHVLVVPNPHQHGPTRRDQAAQGDLERVHAARHRQARGRNPLPSREDGRPAAGQRLRRLDRRRRRSAADDRDRRHHRHARAGPSAHLRLLRPDPEGQVARGTAVRTAGTGSLRHDLLVRARVDGREAAQPRRRHLEHADVGGDHRRRR